VSGPGSDARPGDGVGLVVEVGGWSMLREAVSPLRVAVFVDEQGFPIDEEFDAADAGALHALARLDGEAVGTGRLLPDGRIGRMAVLARARGLGVGGAILMRLVALARSRGDAAVELSAQLHALPFYASHGFEAHGPVYDDTGAPHRAMRLRLV